MSNIKEDQASYHQLPSDDFDAPQMTFGEFATTMIVQVTGYALKRALVQPSFRLCLLMAVEKELIRQHRLEAEGFNGSAGCIARVYRQEGVLGFMRGLWPGLLLSIPSSIVEDIVSGVVQQLTFALISPYVENFGQLSFVVLTVGSTAVISLLTIPIEGVHNTVITNYVSDIKSPDSDEGTFNYKSSVDCCKKIYATKGWRGFFKGATLDAASVVAYRGTYYLLITGTFALMNESQRQSPHPWLSRSLSVLATVVSQPIEVVRRRMMLRDSDYPGPITCARSIVKEEGWTSLFAGLKMRLSLTLASAAVLEAVGFAAHFLRN